MSSAQPKPRNGATVGFEETLWAAADKMRGHLDPAEYKHVALGLIFLKYISDSFEELHQRLLADAEAEWHEAAEQAAARGEDPETLRESWAAATDPEDRDEYTAENVFWVPAVARWTYLQDKAKDPTIGKLLDEAMDAIERDNPSLRGVLPKRYAREDLGPIPVGPPRGVRRAPS
jgi:type I restriction enzyme M protein